MSVFGWVIMAVIAVGVVYFIKRMNDDSASPATDAVDTPSADAAEVVVEKIAEPAKCGCGRSPTGYCQGLHALSDEEWAINDLNPNKLVQNEAKPEEAAKKAPAKRKPAAKKDATKKASKAPAVKK